MASLIGAAGTPLGLLILVPSSLADSEGRAHVSIGGEHWQSHDVYVFGESLTGFTGGSKLPALAEADVNGARFSVDDLGADLNGGVPGCGPL